MEKNKMEDLLEAKGTGIKDEYGVLYSKDGRFLLKANRSLEIYRIKEGTNVLCNSAFQKCDKLKYIYIPDSVQYIGDACFDQCFSLKAMTLPSSIKYLGFNIFLNDELDSVLILSSEYLSESGFILSKDRLHVLSHFGISKDINIPSGVKYIDDYALGGCNIKHINIPNSVIRIGNGAFNACDELEEINLPSNLLEIGESVFSFDNKIKKIIIPANVSLVKGSAFMAMKSINSIIFKGSNTSIEGKLELFGCNNLQKIVIPKGSKGKYLPHFGFHKMILYEDSDLFEPVSPYVSAKDQCGRIRLARIDSFRDTRGFGFLFDLETNEKFYFQRSAISDSSIYIPFTPEEKNNFYRNLSSDLAHGVSMNNTKYEESDKYKNLPLNSFVDFKKKCEFGYYTIRATKVKYNDLTFFQYKVINSDFSGYPCGKLEWGQLVAYKLRGQSDGTYQVYDIMSWSSAKNEIKDSVELFSPSILAFFAKVIPSVEYIPYNRFVKKLNESSPSDNETKEDFFKRMRSVAFNKDLNFSSYLIEIPYNEYDFYRKYNDDVKTRIGISLKNGKIIIAYKQDDPKPDKPYRKRTGFYEATNIYSQELDMYKQKVESAIKLKGDEFFE